MTAPRLPAPFSRRNTPSGAIIGTREPASAGGEVHAWRGLRYAAPPLGPLRWRAPQPAPGWDGDLPALAPGAIAARMGLPEAIVTELLGSAEATVRAAQRAFIEALVESKPQPA